MPAGSSCGRVSHFQWIYYKFPFLSHISLKLNHICLHAIRFFFNFVSQLNLFLGTKNNLNKTTILQEVSNLADMFSRRNSWPFHEWLTEKIMQSCLWKHSLTKQRKQLKSSPSKLLRDASLGESEWQHMGEKGQTLTSNAKIRTQPWSTWPVPQQTAMWLDGGGADNQWRNRCSRTSIDDPIVGSPEKRSQPATYTFECVNCPFFITNCRLDQPLNTGVLAMNTIQVDSEVEKTIQLCVGMQHNSEVLKQKTWISWLTSIDERVSFKPSHIQQNWRLKQFHRDTLPFRRMQSCKNLVKFDWNTNVPVCCDVKRSQLCQTDDLLKQIHCLEPYNY